MYLTAATVVYKFSMLMECTRENLARTKLGALWTSLAQLIVMHVLVADLIVTDVLSSSM